jgi:hypothetical protein
MFPCPITECAVIHCIDLAGLVVYFWHSRPEDQGKVDIQRPSYVRPARRAAALEGVLEAGWEGGSVPSKE